MSEPVKTYWLSDAFFRDIELTPRPDVYKFHIRDASWVGPPGGMMGLLTCDNGVWRPMLFSEMQKLGLCDITCLTERITPP